MRPSVQFAPNVTPMVDVMLVLLVIFMVVAPTLLDGFRAEPPRAVNVRDHPNDSSDVVLGIDAAGRYFLNKRPIDSAALGSLGHQLHRRATRGGRNATNDPCIIGARAGGAHGHFAPEGRSGADSFGCDPCSGVPGRSQEM